MSIEEKQPKLFKTNKEEVADQFQLVEQKIRSLIELTEALKQEKADLVEKLRVQEEALDTLSKEVVSLRVEREQEKHRILTLLRRAEQLGPDIN
ncbi:MAG: hypothetical protein JSW40_03845 [Candidatus Omnitrophota bacterium]|nr:MAG: hypothetical protein JSW40_03845 [Candidatus Omnitrophota bacterium]